MPLQLANEMGALSKKLNKVDSKISSLTKAGDELSKTIQQTESHLKQVRFLSPKYVLNAIYSW